MIIGVISDTHDHLVGLHKAIQIFKDRKIEMLVHCGDWVSPFILEVFDREIEGLPISVKSVVGNNPGDIKRTLMSNSKMKNPIEWPKTVTLEFDIDGKKAIIYHGDDYALLDALIDCQKYDVIFTGHTHAARNEVIKKTLVLNPGSTSYACEGESIEKASVAIYDSKKNKAEIIYFT
jgi:putative phosphoesterase